MTIEGALRQILIKAVTTAVERFYPNTLPPDPRFPAAVYIRVSTPRPRALTGFSGLARPRFQFTAWAEDPKTAKVLADEIRTALDGYQDTIEGVVIQSCFADNELAMYEPDTKRYGIVTDYMVAHNE